jgi:hypothetical protein
MIVVSGTKRSGTSMWMQILIGAGFPFVGERFPARWQERIGEANPDGFYESAFRRGILPSDIDPGTGQPLDPASYARHAVKIFVPGVLRTDAKHLHHVIASMRCPREYEHSRRRMWQLEDASRAEQAPGRRPPARMEPAYEWWQQNYTLIVDALRRRYRFNLCAYDTMLEDPEGTIRAALAWLGAGKLAGARAAVRPEHRTQRALPPTRGVEPEFASVFDELYELVRRKQPLGLSFVKKLEATHRELAPRIQEATERARRARDGSADTGSHDEGSVAGSSRPLDQRSKP